MSRLLKHAINVFGRDFLYGFSSKLPRSFRLRYPVAKYRALLRSFLRAKKYISYFGHPLYYDNWTLPISLQQYPHEVIHKVKQNISGEVASLLDIGANLGQFALTFREVFPNAEIHSFEPNEVAREFLEKNCGHTAIKIFPYGVGKAGERRLFFEENRSATGSLIAANAEQAVLEGTREVQEATVALTDDVSSVTGKSFYDLIKIDVEGSEDEVIRHLGGITCRYLFMEVSLGRDKNFSYAELLELTKNTLGDFELIYQGPVHKGQGCTDLLLEF